MNYKTRTLLPFILTAFIFYFGFHSNAQNWTQVGADIVGIGDYNYISSIDLSADGTRLVTGENSHSGGGFNSNGRVRVFEFDGSTWNLLGSELFGDASGNGFGMWVRMTPDGNTIVCGESRADDNGLQSGKVKVYSWNGSDWQMKGSEILGVTDAEFGSSVDINNAGTRIVVGGPHSSDTDNSESPGEVHLYDWNGSDWVQFGAFLYGESLYDYYGANVSMNGAGDVIAITGRGVNANTGIVRVFEWGGMSWIQRGTDFSGTATEDYYGTSVALDDEGNTVAIGSAYMSNEDGQVEVYEWDGSSWNLRGNTFVGSNGEWLGHSVDLSDNGNTLAVGASWYDGGFLDSGASKCYLWDGNTWNAVGNVITGQAAHNYCGAFDVSVSSDGSYMAVMSYGNDEGGNDGGQARVFSSPKLDLFNQSTKDMRVELYPNPASNVLHISKSNTLDINRLIITSIEGKVLHQHTDDLQGLTNIDVSELRSGNYFVQLFDHSGQVYRLKFVIVQ